MLGPAAGRSLLDVPAGTGYLATRARSEGWTVRALDIDPSLWRGPADVPVAAADLNATLPVATASVDAVACCEGLEHLENPWNALREFRRVLRPGGRLVVSIPNTFDWRQRWRVLFRGHFSHYAPSVGVHVNAMGTVVLVHALLATGYDVLSVRSPRSYANGLFAFLSSPLIRRRRIKGLPDPVVPLLTTREVLFGRTVVVEARAPGGR
jgi:SAM-dependent methyltransferase